MKLSIPLMFFVIQSFCYSQTLTIEYQKKTNAENVLYNKTEYFRMVHHKDKSLYYGVTSDTEKYQYKDFIDDVKEIGKIRLVRLDDNTTDYSYDEQLYKDYLNDTLFLNEIIMNKMVYIGEKIDKLNWAIRTDLRKVILGKTCMGAKTEFRGRKYTAFFSTEYEGVRCGPWKFDGLPGVILLVESDDGYVSFEAMKLHFEDKEVKIDNPFSKTEVISWSDYTKKYKEVLLNALKKMKSLGEDGEAGSAEITSDRMEELGFKKLVY